MSMTYSTATQWDAAGFAHCQLEAFLEDRFYQAAFRLTSESTQEDYQEQYDYRVKRWQHRLQNTNIRWIKAVEDATGTVVGISGWELPEARQSKNPVTGEDVKWPSNWDKEFLELAEKRIKEILKANSIDSDRLWCKTKLTLIHLRPGFESNCLA
jgi:hypothetical protein